MSWSVSYIGTPDNISAALKEQETKLTGSSLTEYQTALPSLLGILALNYNTTPNAKSPVVELTANGHTYASGDSKYGNCAVSLRNISTTLV